ncbi:MAG: MmcQ/YjbR family DNA-binding protein, partial [Pyrinomonadaceae bacterium]
MFILVNLTDLPTQINLKCDPERALELREQYDAITAGYHMNKKHWNTIVLDGTVPSREVREMIDHSYEQVVKGLKKSDREEIGY